MKTRAYWLRVEVPIYTNQATGEEWPYGDLLLDPVMDRTLPPVLYLRGGSIALKCTAFTEADTGDLSAELVKIRARLDSIFEKL